MLTLYQLQNRVCVHAGREEKESSERVWQRLCVENPAVNFIYRAKYIEGLENRLGRMEALLKMSGLLSEDDGGKTDLGTIEKRLAEKSSPNADISRRNSPKISSGTESYHNTPQTQEILSSPRTSVATPGSEKDKEREKEKEAEVEALSDMMCSLVTNNCGETRYIGNLNHCLDNLNQLTNGRLILGLLNFLAQGYPVGQ